VYESARKWAARAGEIHTEAIRIGYFGSYARGEWGVGSDLDLIAVVTRASEPFERRSLAWDLDELPVPAELLVYTATEWKVIQEEGGRFARTLSEETIWVYDYAPPQPSILDDVIECSPGGWPTS
jgi:predicted nucleotidyltransferase